MKQSYTQSPRTLDECTFIAGGQAIHHYPESGTQKIYGYLLALCIAIGLSAVLVMWWAA